jgi:choline dehydrogenase
VHGLSGLRVADASVMPSRPSANTNATAERAARLIQAQSQAAATSRTT